MGDRVQGSDGQTVKEGVGGREVFFLGGWGLVASCFFSRFWGGSSFLFVYSFYLVDFQGVCVGVWVFFVFVFFFFSNGFYIVCSRCLPCIVFF